MKYKRVNPDEVLSAFGNIELIDRYYIPKLLIAQYLNTSLYQVNKQCKILIEKGYLKHYQCEPFHDYEYESGIDYGNSLKIWVTEITDKGYDRLKELGLYKTKWYEDYAEKYFK